MQERHGKLLLTACYSFFFFWIMLLFGLGGCSLLAPDIPTGEPDRQRQESPEPDENAQPENEVPKTPAFTGVSGKYPPEAEMAFAKARVLWKRNSTSTSLGEVCSDPQSAVAFLDKAISLAPEYAEAYIRRGLAKSDLGQNEQAFDDITAGIRLSPTAEAYAYRGLALLRGNNLRAAKKDLEYSLELNSSQHLARNYLGVLALSEDRQREACKAFEDGCDKGDCSFLESAKKENICS